MTTVYGATVLDGVPRPDGDETDDVAWLAPDALGTTGLSEFCRAELSHTGFL